MKSALLLVVSIALLAVLFPATVLALGVAMGPTTLEIPNALRGGEYERVITVFNPSEPQTTYNLRADGQAASWLSFYELSSQRALQSLTIAGQSNTVVLIKVKVPSDITNGSYTATIYAETAPSGDGGNMGVSTILQATSVLTIGVTGDQIIEGTVGDIGARDTEAGLPLRLQVSFQNRGNVVVQPQIDCQISKGKTQVAEFSHAKTAVKPDSLQTILVEWATAADQTGDYVARVKVSLGEKTLATKDVPFKIVPPGTFTKQGELTILAYEGQPLLDTQLKIQAGFKNTGEGDARAKLIAEVYYKDSLIDTIKSEETLVPVGQTGTLTSYLKLAKAGEYTIKGYVAYEGKQTGVKEISVTAGGTSAGTFSLWLPIIGIIGAVVVVAIIMMLWRRRKPA